MERKGLSDVIVTVLLVLLALVAIGVVWFFISPFLSRTTSQVSADCFTVNTKIDSCQVTMLTSPKNGSVIDYQWKVKREPGTGNVQDMKFIFEVDYFSGSSNDAEVVVTQSNISNVNGNAPGKIPGELETTGYKIGTSVHTYGLPGHYLDNQDNVYMTVAPVVAAADSDEQTIVCKPTAERVKCIKR